MPQMNGEKRCLVLALGNELLGDDAVALHLARRLREVLSGSVDVMESTETGLGLLDLLVGYDTIFILDAIEVEKPDGHLRLITGTNSMPLLGGGIHFLGLPDVLHLCHALGLAVPARVMVVGIPIASVQEIREGLSLEMAARLPGWTQSVRGLIEKHLSWCSDGSQGGESHESERRFADERGAGPIH
ncbi:MAG: hydrogenase maturation protease [Anaerolineae bacterium]|nr:hydrogenase maturation protease [Anaerolineae bacterium]MDW8097977.1 hydrogenase maturation protease [Anaerolineae bacterium]